METELVTPAIAAPPSQDWPHTAVARPAAGAILTLMVTLARMCVS